MSTRGIIARKTPAGFAGNYHHYDSYPDGLGSALYIHYHHSFDCDLTRMLHVLIDEHMAGWSTIIDADFMLPPGYVNDDNREQEDPKRPRCYCHGDRHEKPDGLFWTQSDTGGADYAYVFDEQSEQPTLMIVYVYRYPEKRWEITETVDLASPTNPFKEE